jgi:hypothetical protein
MDKARTRKALSAAAAANLTVIGLAAPADASAHTTVTTARAATMPNARKTLPGLVFTSTARRSGASGAEPRGFVPRARANATPDSYRSCNKYVCEYVHGAGSTVDYVSTSWSGQPGVCRSGFIESSNGGYDPTTGCAYSSEVVTWTFKPPAHVPHTHICAGFFHVPGSPCVYIH